MRLRPSPVIILLCDAAAAGHHQHALAFLSSHRPYAVRSPPRTAQSPSVAFTRRNVAATTFPSDVNNDDYVDAGGVGDNERPASMKVCVIGGGFGGINAALTLSSLLSSSSDDKSAARDLEITLLDPKERFVFLPLLYELCVGDADLDEVAPTYESLLSGAAASAGGGGARARIEHVRGSVTGIDVDENCVYYTTEQEGRCDEGRCMYDALVISTGMEGDPSGVPGAKELATTFHTIEDCYDVRRQLNFIKSERGGRGGDHEPLDVVVVGGSYSGVELALNVMEELDESDVGDVNVTLVHRGSDILPFASQFNKDSAKRRLKRAGVEILTGASVTGVTVAAAAAAAAPSPSPPSSSSDDFLSEVVQPRKEVHVRRRTSPAYSAETETNLVEETLPADLLLWTAGSSPPSEGSGALNCSLDRDASGRILVGRSLRAARRDNGEAVSNVFAIGDAARVVVAAGRDGSSSQRRFPATAQVAIQQAPVAAFNVLATLRNANAAAGDDERGGGPPSRREKLLPFRYVDLGEMMTLGSNDATIDSLGGLVKIEGPAASAVRRIIYGVRMPTQRQRLTALAESTPKLVRSRVTEKKLKLRQDKG